MVSRANEALHQISNEYVAKSAEHLHSNNFLQLLNPLRLCQYIWNVFYILTQLIIVTLFKVELQYTRTVFITKYLIFL